MNETLIEQIPADASALNIKITTQEIALYLSENKVPPEHLEALKEFMIYLRQNQRDKAISALLQHSRIPQKEPSTFENFDFSRVTGEHAAQIKSLPNLFKAEYRFYRPTRGRKNSFINGLWKRLLS